jgi:hypothetical protein
VSRPAELTTTQPTRRRCQGTTDAYGNGICQVCAEQGQLIVGYDCGVTDAGQNECTPISGLPGMCCPGLMEQDEKIGTQVVESVVCE